MTEHVWWGIGLIALLGVLVLYFVRPRPRAVEPPIPPVPRSKIHWIAIISLTICILLLIGVIFDEKSRNQVSAPILAYLFFGAGALYVLCDIRYYLGVIAGKQPDTERKAAGMAQPDAEI